MKECEILGDLFMKRIYFDSAASTPVRKEVLDAMLPFFSEKFGNASSLHKTGLEAKEALCEARKLIASKLNASADEIIFTSGGTESNNLTLKGIAFANKEKGNHIITTKIEHPCIFESCKWLETQGFEVTYLKVDKEGFIDLNELKNAITDKTILVSIIHGNNEIGTINDIAAIGKICKEKNVLFHSDACQSFCKVPIDVEKMNIDLLTINSHKIYGPKGVGALFIKRGTKITPLMHGGEHEFSKRAGTENVSGIVGFAKAVELMCKEEIRKVTALRDKLISRILKEIPETSLNGSTGEKRLCNNASFCFKRIEGESILLRLDAAGISVSTASACSSLKLEPSRILLAIGLPREIAHSAIRFSIGIDATEEDIDYAVGNLKKTVEDLREISPLK